MTLSLVLLACGKSPPELLEPDAPPPEPEAEVASAEPEVASAPPAAFASRMVAAGDVAWNPLDPSAPEGPALAIVSGDPAVGPVQALMKFPPGYESGLHTHTADYTAVVLQGGAAHGATEDTLTVLGPGAWWTQPGGESHADSCTGEADCILYIGLDGPLDMAPAQASSPENTMTVTAAADVAWGPLMPEAPDGPQLAVLSGNPAEGSSRLMMQFPTGYASGLHTHTADYTAAVVSGTHGHGAATDGLTALASGSHWTQAGGEAHADACDGGDPCTIVLELHGPMDFALVTEQGAGDGAAPEGGEGGPEKGGKAGGKAPHKGAPG